MEIEKKYLVSSLPDALQQYEAWEIEQCYLCIRPVLRIRKRNEDYILTYKNRTEKPANANKLCVADELEVPLTKEAYEHLKKKADGK